MLAELQLKLVPREGELTYRQSSNLQGVLMNQIDTSYAEKIHHQSMNAYSQYLYREGHDIVWYIKTTTVEAYENIILPLQDQSFSEFIIEKKGIHIDIVDKTVITKKKEELLKDFYDINNTDPYINIEFVSTTSFKSDGEYCIFPTTRLLFQSLMNKYSAASDKLEMFDEETLDQMIVHSRIVNYRLQSASFPLEGVKIPGFRGQLSIRFNGNATMARYARLLVNFGTYSGVGIKTGMGMGAVRIPSKGENKSRENRRVKND